MVRNTGRRKVVRGHRRRNHSTVDSTESRKSANVEVVQFPGAQALTVGILVRGRRLIYCLLFDSPEDLSAALQIHRGSELLKRSAACNVSDFVSSNLPCPDNSSAREEYIQNRLSRMT